MSIETELQYMSFQSPGSGTQRVYIASVLAPLVIEPLRGGGTRLTFSTGQDVFTVDVADGSTNVRDDYQGTTP